MLPLGSRRDQVTKLWGPFSKENLTFLQGVSVNDLLLLVFFCQLATIFSYGLRICYVDCWVNARLNMFSLRNKANCQHDFFFVTRLKPESMIFRSYHVINYNIYTNTRLYILIDIHINLIYLYKFRVRYILKWIPPTKHVLRLHMFFLITRLRQLVEFTQCQQNLLDLILVKNIFWLLQPFITLFYRFPFI